MSESEFNRIQKDPILKSDGTEETSKDGISGKSMKLQSGRLLLFEQDGRERSHFNHEFCVGKFYETRCTFGSEKGPRFFLEHENA